MFNWAYRGYNDNWERRRKDVVLDLSNREWPCVEIGTKRTGREEGNVGKVQCSTVRGGVGETRAPALDQALIVVPSHWPEAES